jgi:hypothetical protein
VTARTNFPGVKQDGSDSPQQQALVTNQTLLGKTNNTLAVALRAGFTTTVVADPRIDSTSVFVFDPRTANARAALFSAYVSAVANGTMTITHTNTATTDRNFIVAIIA